MTRRVLILTVAVIGLAGIALVTSNEPADAILLQGTFIDDNQSPHQNGIEAIAALGITQGCNPPTNNRFCPNREMSRAEAATFLARALKLPDDGNDYFTDDDGHPLEGGINRIAAAGITAGCNPPANTKFCPDRHLTRAEFAAFIVRGLNLPQTSTNYFTDDNGHVLENAINAIAEAGITVGCNPPANTWFCPQRVLTRGETATLLTRALSLNHNPQAIPLTDWTPVTCSKDGISCRLDVITYSGRTHVINEGLFNVLPYGPGEQSIFVGTTTKFTLTLDGSPVAMTDLGLTSTSSQARRTWTALLTFTEGSHLLVGEWRRGGTLIRKTTAHLDVD
jgi:hypothetical protein